MPQRLVHFFLDSVSFKLRSKMNEIETQSHG